LAPQLFDEEKNLVEAASAIRLAASQYVMAILFQTLFLTRYCLENRAFEVAEFCDGYEYGVEKQWQRSSGLSTCLTH
jgi:predicted amidohydrolase